LIIEKEELQTLIPHKGKMLLLSRVIEYDIEHSVRAEYDITRNCLFYDPVLDGVPSWAGFEFIAQAVSVLTGIRKREKGRKTQYRVYFEYPVHADGNSVI